MASDRWVKLKFSVPGTVREDSRKAKDMVRKNTANILQKKDQGTEHFQDRCSELWTKQTNLLFASYCTQENNETCTSINYKKKRLFQCQFIFLVKMYTNLKKDSLNTWITVEINHR